MNAVSPQLTIKPSTLYASRGPASIFLEAMDDTPRNWLYKHGVSSPIEGVPVVVMLDPGDHGKEYCDVVALEYGDEQPLARIAEAIAALQLAYEALTAAGHEDFARNTTEKGSRP